MLRFPSSADVSCRVVQPSALGRVCASGLVPAARRFLWTMFTAFLLSAAGMQTATATALNSIQDGRASLKLQTPAGLRAAKQSFKAALDSAPDNLEANFLYAMTLLTL